MLNKNQKGFSLIETIVAMGILSVVTTLGMNYFSMHFKSRETRTIQSIFRYLAIQATQTVTIGSAFYPPISAPAPSEKVLYVGCFDGKGEQINNVKGVKEFQLHFAENYLESKASGQCNENAFYEVRFYWEDIASSKVAINIVSLKKDNNPTGYNFKNYAIYAR